MDQPAGVPRFNEDSAFIKHWPLLWLTVISALIVASFVPDFQKLVRVFETNAGSTKVYLQTNYIFHGNRDRNRYQNFVDTGKISSKLAQTRVDAINTQAHTFATTITADGYYATEDGDAKVVESKNYLSWLFHRRLGLYFAEHQDFDAAHMELAKSLDYANALGEKYPCKALTLSEMAFFAQLRAQEMQQAAQMLLGAALPIFSFLAALLPFALFLAFIKSRDKTEFSRRESENAGPRLFLKTLLLASWFGVIVTGWIALRNYGMGIAVTMSEPCTAAFFAAMGALLLSCCLLIRYMPPYKSLSLKRTILGCGFGGVLLALKAIVIYFGLCSSLAGHPMLKEALFCEPLRMAQANEAKSLALQARSCAVETLKGFPFLQDRIVTGMTALLMPTKTEGVGSNPYTIYDLQSVLREGAEADLVLEHNDVVPYVWNLQLRPSIAVSTYGHPNEGAGGITLGMTIKACLAYLLFFCPEFLAYPLLALRQRQLALKTFRLALRVKEYCLGVDHWLVVSMMELFGSCLLAFHKQPDFEGVGEFYLREAITRYERSRGRHDQLTIAAKMSLVRLYNERGDDKQAERILLEALRDVGKDFDVLAYSDLLSEIGKTYCRQNKYSRAKQMYKQVIELLELKLSKCPPSRGLFGWVHNIYATIPSFQLEVKLVNAYLDLAEVFHLAKYNGEAQRLTDDANKKISDFEKDVIVGMEVVVAYSRARIAQATILCQHGRYDECFKLLADAKKQMRRWGYQRYIVTFEVIVAECELGIVASKAVPRFFAEAKKNYMECCLRFGNAYTLKARADLGERWLKIGEIFSSAAARSSNFTAGGAFISANEAANSFISDRSGGPQQDKMDLGLDFFTAAQTSWWMPISIGPASASSPTDLRSQSQTEAQGPDQSQKQAQSQAAGGSLSKADDLAARASEARKQESTHSQVIKDLRAVQDEGIVIRWQREQRDELMLKLRPERG